MKNIPETFLVFEVNKIVLVGSILEMDDTLARHNLLALSEKALFKLYVIQYRKGLIMKEAIKLSKSY